MNSHSVSDALAPLFVSSNLLAVLLAIAALTLLRSRRNSQHSSVPLQIICVAITLFGLGNSAYLLEIINANMLVCLEIIAGGFWLASTLRILSHSGNARQVAPLKLGLFLLWASALFTILALVLLPDPSLPQLLRAFPVNTPLLPVLGLTGLLSVLAFRTPLHGQRESNGYFLSASILFSLDYCMVALNGQIATTVPGQAFANRELLFNASGLDFINLVTALLVPMLACIGAVKYKPRHKLSLSRKMALYGISLAGAATFMVVLSFVGVYAASYSGPWATLLEFAILFIACIGLGYVSLSGQLRNSIRVSIDKHIFSHKYDYRNVWLTLIQTLSHIPADEDFFEQGLQAVGKIFDAPGGAIWVISGNRYALAANWNIDEPLQKTVMHDEGFIQPFVEEEWIYALNVSGQREHDRHLHRLPNWIRDIDNIWVTAPLMLNEQLLGFFVLTRDAHNESLIWEDIDVIKSTGRQLASYIVRQQSAEALAQSRQFDAYNKLTAFIMHDLKNLIAQQALVVENAQKHKENPAFVEDAIRTIDNSVTRMNQLLKRLQRNSRQSVQRSVSVKEVVTEAVRKAADRQPIPTLRGDAGETYIVADRDQLVMILLHIIRNAQEATSSDGFIDIDIGLGNAGVTIDIEDNGCGMDEEFINTRLFKPFDSTKSSMGMGIGAYQAREFIETMGGKLSIKSQPDVGTTVYVELPIAYSETERVAAQ